MDELQKTTKKQHQSGERVF